MPTKKTSTRKTAAVLKTAEEELIIEEAVEQVAEEIVEQVEMKVITQPVLTPQLMLAAPKPPPAKRDHPARPMPQAREQFDLN